jgi:hypothetical protein
MAGERAAKRAAVLCAAMAAALVSVATAVAAENYTFRFTAADQAAARSTVIRRADIGSSRRWKGGLIKPDLSAPPACMGTKLADLVVTGAAESNYSGSGIWFDSQAELLQTPRMVTVDWQRLMHKPNLLSCYRSEVAKAAPRIGKVGSIRWIAFPHIAPHVKALRLNIAVPVSGTPVRFIYDSVLIGRGRTEITLTTLAPYAARAAVFAAEQRLATTLVNRCPN